MAFSKCENLLDAEIEEGVELIGVAAFENCTALKTVRIPGSVTNIPMSYFNTTPFNGCENVTVCCPKGSYAEKFCTEHNIPFIAE